MLLLASYDIVFQEVPGEVTLALNLSACPNRCPGCHSPHLREAVGEPLDETLLDGLLGSYGDTVSCVGFMGGDGDTGEVNRLAAFVKGWRRRDLKTAWYSGRAELPEEGRIDLSNFDYIKLGPYTAERGGLGTPGTNQRFYRVGPDGTLADTTSLFDKKNTPLQ